jgi:hypothetical protein
MLIDLVQQFTSLYRGGGFGVSYFIRSVLWVLILHCEQIYGRIQFPWQVSVFSGPAGEFTFLEVGWRNGE